MTVPRVLVLVSLSFVSLAHVGTSFSQSVEPLRGQLLGNPPALQGTYSGADLIAKVSDGTVTRWLLEQVFSPPCSVNVYYLQYGTVGGQGEPATASGALMVPTGAGAPCQGHRPVVLYGHGKRNPRSFNLANLDNNFEALVLALGLAGEGYIVVAPNYVGYDTSSLSYHPFLNADQQAADMMDALAAARTAFPAIDAAENGHLFITGYSEGGYVAMATHRAMQAAGMPVTASAPMSGPYALSAFVDQMFMGQVGQDAVDEFAMLVSSYQHAYGNVYVSPTDVFVPQYASADTLLPTTAATDLASQGLLPANAVFSSIPPLPALASLTPATSPANLAVVFAAGFGPSNLISNSYRLRYLDDEMNSPDGGLNATTYQPPANPTVGLRQDLKANDLRNWVPTSPMLLCGGDADPVVFYSNTVLASEYWKLHPPQSGLWALDVDGNGAAGFYGDIQRTFNDTKNVVAFIEGSGFVRDNYHGILVPAFCMQAARKFFDSFSELTVMKRAK